MSKLAQKHHSLLAARAQHMRHHLTWSELLLWQQIRGRKLGVGFKRQVPLGRYIADFVAAEARLVVEVEGGWHASRRAADARRERALQRLGFRVLRLPAELVEKEVDAAVRLVRRALEAPWPDGAP